MAAAGGRGDCEIPHEIEYVWDAESEFDAALSRVGAPHRPGKELICLHNFGANPMFHNVGRVVWARSHEGALFPTDYELGLCGIQYFPPNLHSNCAGWGGTVWGDQVNSRAPKVAQ